MKLKSVLKELGYGGAMGSGATSVSRGSWGIYGHRQPPDKEQEPEIPRDPYFDEQMAEQVAEQLKTTYQNLMQGRTVKRLHVQMIIGELMGRASREEPPDIEMVIEYLRKHHKIRVE